VTKIHFADVASIKDRIYHSTAVAHITIKYNLAADMARDEEIDLSYVPTAEMIASWGNVELMGITYITMQRTMIFLASFVVNSIIWRTILCWCDMSRHTIQQKQLRIHPHTLDCLSTHHPTTQHVFVHTGGRYYDCRLMWLCCQLIH
jgi:hypothetical protein